METDIKRYNYIKPCCVKGCPGKTSDDIGLFSIPPTDVNAWCTNLNLKPSEINEYTRVCSRHFEKSLIGSKRLRRGARPTLDLGDEGFVILSLETDKPIQQRDCCIAGCNVTSPPNALFTFPEEKKRLNQWLLICDIKEHMAAHKRKFICAKHFDSSMVVGGKTLVKDAIPKLEALNWVHKNTNIKEDEMEELDFIENTLNDNSESLSAVSYFKEEPCVVKGCPGRNSERIRLFKIPKSDINAWCALLNLKPSDVNDSLRVCSRHFKKSYIGFTKLMKGARPTLNLGNKGFVLPSLEPKKYSSRYICCIVGCNSTSPANKLFTFPDDTELLKEWLSICVIKERLARVKRKFICGKHFDASMVMKNKLRKGAKPKKEAQNWFYDNACNTHAASSIDDYSWGNEFKSDSDSDVFDGLECKSSCPTCVEVFKDCEMYRERFVQLEKALQEEQANYEATKIRNEKLMAELRRRKI